MNKTSTTGPMIAEEPGGRPPAPGALLPAQQFVNTHDREAGLDSLDSRQALAAWLRYWTVWPADALPTHEEHARAIVVREGIRELADIAGNPPSGDFGAAVAAIGIRLAYTDGQLVLTSADRLGKALAPILAAVRTAMADGSWGRMKVCARDRCRWLYYDSSRNGSSRWCATQICGSREKARRAYRRKTQSDR